MGLKLHRLKQDIYDHVASMHGGFIEDPTQQDEARRLRLTFEQFQQSLWPQVGLCGLGGGCLPTAGACIYPWPPSSGPPPRSPCGKLRIYSIAPLCCHCVAFLLLPPQFSVWEPHTEDRSEAAETESARRKFVLLDVDSDNYLTAEVGVARGVAEDVRPQSVQSCMRSRGAKSKRRFATLCALVIACRRSCCLRLQTSTPRRAATRAW